MKLDELDRHLQEEADGMVEGVVVDGLDDVEELSMDPVMSLSLALSLMREVGDLLEEILELKRKTIPPHLRTEMQQASDEIEAFLDGNAEVDIEGEEWER